MSQGGLAGVEHVNAAGHVVRAHRQRRRISQMELALGAGISPRHLSFIETGRSNASSEVLMTLAEQLEMPLRERNSLLLAGGFAPRYAERPLQAPEMQPVMHALQRLLSAHQPYPGLVLDRQWNAVLTNDAAKLLASLLPPHLCEPVINVYRASLHPEGLARFTLNFDEWAEHLLLQLRRSIEVTGDAALLRLEGEVLQYPNVATIRRKQRRPTHPSLLVPTMLETPLGRMSMFTTLTSFGTPRDVTLDELCVELFYPADEATESLFRSVSK